MSLNIEQLRHVYRYFRFPDSQAHAWLEKVKVAWSKKSNSFGFLEVD